jgi:DNA-binding GntR family transcriptional regulator
VLLQQSLVAMADQEIRRLILTGELAPGDRLFEVRLSERLGISRPPLREALRILAAEHILEQVYGLRNALEEYALTLLLPKLQNTDLDGLTGVMAQMWRAAHADDEARVVAANRDFHLTLVGLAGHSRLTHAYRALMDQMQLCMAANLHTEARSLGDLFEGCRRHDRLLDSLRGRDPGQVRTALREHGERSYLGSATAAE